MKLCATVLLDGVRTTVLPTLCHTEPKEGLTAATYTARVGAASLTLLERADEALDCRVLQLTVRNEGEVPLRLSQADAGIAIENTWDDILRYFSSNWGRECDPLSMRVTEKQSIQVLSGRSSKGYAPWMGLETKVGIFSLSVGWSGNWRGWTERGDEYLYAHMGIAEYGFYTDLAPGASFTGAPLYVAYDAQDAELASVHLRRFFLEHFALKSPHAGSSLPTVYNTWWSYEDRFINEEVCLRNAQAAKEAGLDQFMLDAGWFGPTDGKDNWFEKRGDWDVVNTRDFPHGMACLGAKINGMGIRFGIWCEIEAVSQKAELNRVHPDFPARRNGQPLHYVCMGNPRVREWALGVLGKLVEQYHAHWVKLDFNVDPELGCNEPGHGHGQGDGLYAHITGYYQMLDELRERYPGLHIENCCSGGLRQDLGILEHTHGSFLSDPDYLDHHFQVYWGTTTYIHPALCYHFVQSECCGNINDVPNLINGEMPPEEFDYYIRAGLLCQPGFSFRLENWPQWCIERLKRHIDFFKENSLAFLQQGDMVRLTGQAIRDGGGDRWQAYQFHAADDRSLVAVFRLPGADAARCLRPKLLTPDARYSLCPLEGGQAQVQTGKEWMEEGFTVEGLAQKRSIVYKMKRV